MRIVFFGTPPFAAHILERLFSEGHDVVAVVTRPDRAQGRSLRTAASAVKKWLSAHAPETLLLQPEKVSTEETEQQLAPLDADLFIVVAFGEILRNHILHLPRKGCINIHASLLPQYRGAAPIQRAIMAGDQETGVSVMEMVRKMDAGAVLSVAKVPISSTITAGELEESLAEAGAQALMDVLKDFDRLWDERRSQDESVVTFAPKITVEECRVDWRLSAIDLHNHIRGVAPRPGAWAEAECRGRSVRIKILQTEVVDQATGSAAFIVPCGEGFLKIEKLQPQGKKVMSGEEFLRGMPLKEIRWL